MNKTWKLWLMSLVAVFVLAACGTAPTEDKPKVDEPPVTEDEGQEDSSGESAEEAYPMTVTDAIGNEVTLETAPSSIVSMQPSNTEILFALGLADEIIGVNDYDDYPAEALEKEKIGGMEFNVEKIIELDPEVVFAHNMSYAGSEDGFDQIRNAGIPVFVVENATNFEDTYKTIETIGQLTNKVEEADQIIDEMKTKIEDVLAKVKDIDEEKTVFVETSPAPEIYTPGQGTFVQEILDMIGAKNIADDQEGWFVMDPEEIVNRDPETIIVMYDYIDTAVEDVYARDGFDTIKAIQEEQVIQVDENLTSHTGPRLAEGLEAFAKAVYPEAFGE